MTGFQLTDPFRRRSVRTQVGAVTGLLVFGTAAVLWGPALLRAEASRGEINPLARFLLAVAVVLLVCHVCGELMRRWGQPPVLGEIVGGLLLGPSALGLAWPAAQDWLFHADVLVHLDRAAQLGLVIFMFLLGCELRTDMLRGPRVLGAVVAGSMGLPLIVGVGFALLFGGLLAGPTANAGAFVGFLGLALAITALPVLARILVDLRIDRTRVGVVAISAAAIGDGVAWTLLAVILAASDVTGGGHAATTAGLAVAFVMFVGLCVRPALAALDRYLGKRDGNEQVLLAVLVVGAIGSGAVSELIGLHPVIGAFLFGVAVPRRSPAVEQISRRIQGFTLAILLPLFFAGVGLKTSVGLLGSDPMHWVVFAAVLLIAVGTKFAGAGAGARLAGLPAADAMKIGVLMNCRGITELVVASIGLRYGLISPLGFTVLVLVAVITTAVTGPLMRVLLQRHPSESPPGAPARRPPGQRVTPTGRTVCPGNTSASAAGDRPSRAATTSPSRSR